MDEEGMKLARAAFYSNCSAMSTLAGAQKEVATQAHNTLVRHIRSLSREHAGTLKDILQKFNKKTGEWKE